MVDRLKQLFEAAVELGAAQRDGFVAEACGDDRMLRDRLIELLRAHEDAGDFLEHPTGLVQAIAAADQAEPVGELVAGARVDGYVLVERIGVGGFGSVWRARQDQPVEREVALKVLHAAGDSVRAAARFADERQNLARMRHPSIAKVFDAGVTAAGRLWMAMELVEGRPLVTCCRDDGLGLSARLRLFVAVCQAVQYAHGKGIVHRDLKPSNVLVVDRDGVAEPVIVDFGVACTLDVADAMAGDEVPVGTPEYMSPEQAAADYGAIDTRTDVYALGVLLYELIGGALPFTRPAGIDAAQRLLRQIREDELVPPSRRATAMPRLPIELDWVVTKAMSKDPAGRYATAAALADDVQRVLEHEPVSVGPSGPAYRLRKFARRHRLVVAAAVAILLTSSLGSFVAVRGWLDARHAERIALLAEQGARADQRQAERASQRAQRALDLLDDLWESADPARFGRADYPVRELFEDFELMLPSRVVGEPEVEHRVRLSLSRVQRIVGALHRAQVHADRAVEIARELDPLVGLPTALVEQARVLFDRGTIAAAAAAVAEGLAHVDVAATPLLVADLCEVQANCLQRQGDATAAIAASERAMTLRRQFGDSLEVARSALQSANIHGSRGNVDLALEHLESTRHLLAPFGADHPDALVALQHEALLLLRRGDKAGAQKCLLECLQRRRGLYGAGHPQVAWTEVDLAWLWHEQGRDAEAEPLLRRAVEALRDRLGDRHVFVTEATQRLGAVLVELKSFDEAESMLRTAVVRFRTLPAHPVDGLVGCLGNLAALLWKTERREEAVAAQGEALQVARKQLPEDHFVTSVSMTNLAWMSAELGRPEQAIELLTEALARSSAAGRLGEAKIQRDRLVTLLRQSGREQQAEALEIESRGR